MNPKTTDGTGPAPAVTHVRNGCGPATATHHIKPLTLKHTAAYCNTHGVFVAHAAAVLAKRWSRSDPPCNGMPQAGSQTTSQPAATPVRWRSASQRSSEQAGIVREPTQAATGSASKPHKCENRCSTGDNERIVGTGDNISDHGSPKHAGWRGVVALDS